MNTVNMRHLNRVAAIAIGKAFNNYSFINASREAAMPVNPLISLADDSDWNPMGNNRQAIEVASYFGIAFEEIWVAGDVLGENEPLEGCYKVTLGGKDLPIYVDLSKHKNVPAAIRFGVCSLAYELATGYTFSEDESE